MQEPPPFMAGAALHILQQLAIYRYLTAQQLHRLGVSGGARLDHVWERLRYLERLKLVGRQRFGVDPNEGKMPDVIWLTARGAEYVEGATFAGRRPQGGADIRHRLAIVDVHISLRAWAARHGWRVVEVRTEFDPSGRTAKATAVPLQDGQTYVPDALALVSPDDETRVLVIEVYRGGWKANLEHFRRQLPKLAAVAENSCVESELRATRRARFLLTFYGSQMLEQAIRAVPDPDSERWAGFFFGEQSAVTADFSASWHDVRGNGRELLG